MTNIGKYFNNRAPTVLACGHYESTDESEYEEEDTDYSGSGDGTDTDQGGDLDDEEFALGWFLSVIKVTMSFRMHFQ